MGKRYRLGTSHKNKSFRPAASSMGRSRRQTCWILFFCLSINVVCYFVYLHYPLAPSMLKPHQAKTYNFSVKRMSFYERVLPVRNGTMDDDGTADDGATFVDKKLSVDDSQPGPDPHNYAYLLNEPDLCKRDDSYVRLIIVVTSGLSDFEQRFAIRETWGTYARQKEFGVKLIFLVGFVQNLVLQKKLQRESMMQHDIVQVDFHDSYRNLTIKSIAMLKWVSVYCPNARFVLKSDDDMYINVPKLLQALDGVKEPRFFLCNMQYGARPVRDKKSKWFVLKNEFSQKVYPNYCSGTAYSFSVSVTADLFLMATRTSIFWLEDVFISGLLPKHVPLKQLHNAAFEYWKNSLAKPCHFKRLITSHKMTPKDLRLIWKLLKRPLRC